MEHEERIAALEEAITNLAANTAAWASAIRERIEVIEQSHIKLQGRVLDTVATLSKLLTGIRDAFPKNRPEGGE